MCPEAQLDLLSGTLLFCQGRQLFESEKCTLGCLGVLRERPSGRFTFIEHFHDAIGVGRQVMPVAVLYGDHRFHDDIQTGFFFAFLDDVFRRGEVVFTPSARHAPSSLFAYQEDLVSLKAKKESVISALRDGLSAQVKAGRIESIDSAKIALDASVVVLNIIGQVLLSLAFAEQWYIWTAVNVFSILLWINRLMSPGAETYTAVMLIKYCFYLLNSLNGIRIWLKLSHEDPEAEISTESQSCC